MAAGVTDHLWDASDPVAPLGILRTAEGRKGGVVMAEVLHESGRDTELLKMAVDSVKHITTLASGTIVLLAAFSDKLPKPLANKKSLVAALISMALCLTASFIFLWAETLARYRAPKTHNEVISRFRAWGRPKVMSLLSSAIYFSFVAGMYFLINFAVANI